MIRRSRSLPFSTSAVAGAVLATGALVAFAGDASAQRGSRGSRGTMSVPRVTTTPPPRPSGGSTARSSPPSTSGRGYITSPGPSSGARGSSPRRGDLPRIVMQPPRRGYAYGRDHGTPSFSNRGSRYWRGSSTRWGVGGTCVYGCSGIRAGIRVGRFSGSFLLGYPLFAVPVVIPYYHHVEYERYDEVGAEPYAAESPRAASRLIVVGGSGGGSDALTVETLGDSVRLSWLANGRQAREVKLFVADSARRELATRSASPSAPTATFEVATLSSPVAFAGVTVVFADGVTSTTLVPYRGDPGPARPR